MVLDSIKYALGFGNPSDEEQKSTQEFCGSVATLQENKKVARSTRLISEQGKVDAEPNTQPDLKNVAGGFSGREKQVSTPAIKSEKKRVYRSIKVLKAATRAANQKDTRTCADGVAEANTLRARELADASQSYKRAVAGLLKVEEQVRKTAQDIHDKKAKEANSKADTTIDSLTRKRDSQIAERDKQTAEMVQRLNARLGELDQEMAAQPLDAQFDRIDMGFLRMRKAGPGSQRGLPLFAVFTPDDPICQLSCKGHKPHRSTQIAMTTSASPQILEQYVSTNLQQLQDFVGNHMRQSEYNRSWYEYTVTGKYTAEFTGVIPQEVREVIRKSRKQFDHIYIVTEAPEWKPSLEETAILRVPVGDPLVIGEKAGLFWLINAFDTTPAEEHAWREFSSNTRENRQ